MAAPTGPGGSRGTEGERVGSGASAAECNTPTAISNHAPCAEDIADHALYALGAS